MTLWPTPNEELTYTYLLSIIGAPIAHMFIRYPAHDWKGGIQWTLVCDSAPALSKLILNFVVRVQIVLIFTLISSNQDKVTSGTDITAAITFMSRINTRLQKEGQHILGRIHIVKAGMVAVPINEKSGGLRSTSYACMFVCCG